MDPPPLSCYEMMLKVERKYRMVSQIDLPRGHRHLGQAIVVRVFR